MQIETSDFLAWAKQQPPNAIFYFQNTKDCASCQYLRSRLPADKNIYALIRTYEIDGKTYAFPEVLIHTFENLGQKYGDRVAYGTLVEEIELARLELERKEEDVS